MTKKIQRYRSNSLTSAMLSSTSAPAFSSRSVAMTDSNASLSVRRRSRAYTPAGSAPSFMAGYCPITSRNSQVDNAGAGRWGLTPSCASVTLQRMLSRAVAGIVLTFGLALLAAAPQPAAVRVWAATVQLPTYAEGPANPNPPFDLFTFG